MSRHGEITLAWGDRDHTFRLGIGEWVRISEKCGGAGPEEITQRLAVGVAVLEAKLNLVQAYQAGLTAKWQIHDVREVIHQGLRGGDPALGPVDIARLLTANVDERPLRQSLQLAYCIAAASLDGVPGDEAAPPGEGNGEPDPAPNTGTRTSTGGADAPA